MELYNKQATLQHKCLVVVSAAKNPTVKEINILSHVSQVCTNCIICDIMVNINVEILLSLKMILNVSKRIAIRINSQVCVSLARIKLAIIGWKLAVGWNYICWHRGKIFLTLNITLLNVTSCKFPMSKKKTLTGKFNQTEPFPSAWAVINVHVCMIVI